MASIFILAALGLSSCQEPVVVKNSAETTAGVHNDDGFDLKVKVNNGGTITSELKVAIQMVANGAHEMYVTQESSCTNGGAWESFVPFKQWTIKKPNETNFFYVKVRNDHRESDCSFTSILHDSKSPTIQVTAPVDGATLTNPNELSLEGTCNEEVNVTIVIANLTNTTMPCLGGLWKGTVNTTLLPSGFFVVHATGTDLAQNSSATLSLTFLK